MGSNPIFPACVYGTHQLKLKGCKAQVERMDRFNMSKVVGTKVVRMLAVTGKILDSQLGFSFPVGLVKLPVVGGLLK